MAATPIYADITALNAVESQYSGRKHDPWITDSRIELVNSLVYGSEFRVLTPIQRNGLDPEDVPLPALVRELRRHSDFKVLLEPVEVWRETYPGDDWIYSYLEDLVEWAQLQRPKVQAWSAMHRQAWLDKEHQGRMGATLIDFNEAHPEIAGFMEASAAKLELSVNALRYLFDVVARLRVYAPACGDHPYVYHHVRRGFGSEASTTASVLDSRFSFEGWATGSGARLNRERFVRKLLQLRAAVQESGLANLRADEVEPLLLRRVGEDAGLPLAFSRGAVTTIEFLVDVLTPFLKFGGDAAELAGGALATPVKMAVRSFKGPLPRSLHGVVSFATRYPDIDPN